MLNGLDLSAGNAFGNTVGVPSTDVPAMNRITAGDPLQSYIIHTLRGTQLTVGGAGERMPLQGSTATNEDAITFPVVSNDEIAAIVAWILAGAGSN